jgi:hypothetical protein
MSPPANASHGRVDAKRSGLCHPAGDEGERSPGYREQCRTRNAIGIADEFIQRQVSTGRKDEHGAINEANSDLPVGRRLDHITVEDGITHHDLNGNAVGTP